MNCKPTYGVLSLPFRPGDCVVDVAAHIGPFSIALALRFPFLRIYAYEPYPPNRTLLDRNIALNGVTGIAVHPEALSGDGRRLEMRTNPANSGVASAYAQSLRYGSVSGIPSIRLGEVFARHGIARCSLLKIDCEGAEYEVLYSADVWGRVAFLCGEFHSNAFLEHHGHTPEALAGYCRRRMGANRVRVTSCRMSE